MTPPRLVELQCPRCHSLFWEIDSDFRGASLFGGVELTYPERTYKCRACGREGTGHVVTQQSPPEFLLQPHKMYPMTQLEFDRWAQILREHFPDHPLLNELGRSFRPCLPEHAHRAQPPVLEMQDARGRHHTHPAWSEAADRLRKLRVSDALIFVHKDGMTLRVQASGRDRVDASCSDWSGVVATAIGIARDDMLVALQMFFVGNVNGCLSAIAPPGAVKRDS